MNSYLPTTNGLKYSFEFFPTTQHADEHDFWRVLGNLETFEPEFFSVTYGALGSARKKSLQTVEALHTHTNTQIAAHLTVVDSTKTETDFILESLWNNGIRHIVALTGDARRQHSFCGYQNALELVKAIKNVGDFEVSVAAYPEVHPKAVSAQSDIDCLKAKFDAGANTAITQYFFEVDNFLRFRDQLTKQGISNPVIPGILPIHDFFKVKKFSQRCGTHIPDYYALHFSGMEGNVAAQHQLALDLALELCEKLVSEGVDQLHFYTLNRSDLVLEIVKQLNYQFELENHYQNVA